MGGKVLDLEAIRIRDAGRTEGRLEGRAEGRSDAEKGETVEEIIDLTGFR